MFAFAFAFVFVFVVRLIVYCCRTKVSKKSIEKAIRASTSLGSIKPSTLDIRKETGAEKSRKLPHSMLQVRGQLPTSVSSSVVFRPMCLQSRQFVDRCCEHFNPLIGLRYESSLSWQDSVGDADGSREGLCVGRNEGYSEGLLEGAAVVVGVPVGVGSPTTTSTTFDEDDSQGKGSSSYGSWDDPVEEGTGVGEPSSSSYSSSSSPKSSDDELELAFWIASNSSLAYSATAISSHGTSSSRMMMT